MIEYQTLTDQQLISRFSAGSDRAFAEFYARYSVVLIEQAYKVLKDDEEAKDVVQEMFIRILENRESLNITTSLASYLHASIRNKVIDCIRRKKTKDSYLDSLDAYMDHGTKALDETYIEKETLALILREVESLSARTREVFELSRNQGLSHKQIAEQLNISDTTVKKHISNAIRELRLKSNLLLSILFL